MSPENLAFNPEKNGDAIRYCSLSHALGQVLGVFCLGKLGTENGHFLCCAVGAVSAVGAVGAVGAGSWM